jgi:hypothetical protein
MKIVQKITQKLFPGEGRIALQFGRTNSKPTAKQAMYEDQYGQDITAALNSPENLDAAGVLGEAVTIYSGGYKLTEEQREAVSAYALPIAEEQHHQFSFYTISPDRLRFGDYDVTDHVTQNFISRKYMEVVNSPAYRIRVSFPNAKKR